MSHDPNRTWGRRLLLILLGVFAVVLGVNMVMIHYARSTFSGVTDQDAYARGLAYNTNLSEKYREEALGWKMADRSGEGRLAYLITDRDGLPLRGAVVQAVIARPVGEEERQAVELKESEPGLYGAAMTLPAKGQWQVDVSVKKGNDTFTAEERLVK